MEIEMLNLLTHPFFVSLYTVVGASGMIAHMAETVTEIEMIDQITWYVTSLIS